MTWRDHTWEFCVVALSWFVAIGAIAFVLSYLAFEACQTRKNRRP